MIIIHKKGKTSDFLSLLLYLEYNNVTEVFDVRINLPSHIPLSSPRRSVFRLHVNVNANYARGAFSCVSRRLPLL